MGRTVDELLDSISYPELIRWGKYYEAEPFGEWRADVRSAHIVSTLANINRDTKKRSKPYSIDEFLLFKRPVKDKAKTTTKKTATKSKSTGGAKMDPALMAWLFRKARVTEDGKVLPDDKPLL